MKKILIICSKNFYGMIASIKDVLDNKYEIFLPNCYDNPNTEFEMKEFGVEKHREFKAKMFKQSENTIKEMALRVSRVLGVGFASIDIVELYDGTLLVLEANSGVMMNNFSVNLSNGKDIAKDIYTKVLKEMFK